MRKILVLLSMSVVWCAVSAQNTFVLSGKITDEKNKELPGAAIVVSPGEKGVVSDARGNYRIDGITEGKYQVRVSFIGYRELTDSVQVSSNSTFNCKLKFVPLNLQEVVVTDNYAETRKKEETLNVEVVNDDFLRQNAGGSLMKSLERLPGVSTIDIGSGHSKPVIRGLGFNRVVVVENGVKHEGQQWGADHGLEIDQYSVDNVEVIKGPASLMFGSDAVGGVIDIKQNHLPVDHSINGEVNLVGKTNNNLLGTSVEVAGRKDWFFARLQATVLDYGDYKVPADSVDIYSYRVPLYKNHLRNTAGYERNWHLSFGIVKPRFQSRFFVSNISSKSGFFANAHGLEPRNVDTELHDKSNRDILYPFQQVDHFKVVNKNWWKYGKTSFTADLGFQRNFRQEKSYYTSHGYMPPVFPDTMSFAADLEREFDKYVYTGTLKASLEQNTQTTYTAGISSEYQENRIDGRGFIIPAFQQFTLGGFLVAKHSFSEKSLLQFGLRFDYGTIKTEAYYDWFSSPTENGSSYLQRAQDLDRSFSNVSWSAGYSYSPEHWLLKVNVGKSFRMPIAKELAANGVNYHHFSYEVGNPDLSAEVSYQLDGGVEYHSQKLAVGITPFLNYFPNYIYLNPTSEHDRLYGNGNQVYIYQQSEVFRLGGELHAHYQLLKSLQVGIMGEYVYSEQLSGEKKGFTLPFSPPASAIVNLKYRKEKFLFFQHAYTSVDYRLTAAQNNIVPPEETTDAYQTVNLGMGGEVKIRQQNLKLSLQVQNLFNTRYFNHTSYYRLINLPESGRNFILNVSIPFSGEIK
ncbi:TonB-dependent receptor [Maribellus luteus]|uniref:TonB-dependent receptor n=1 Tax=Maribellus luteus TaxID=2305463 RepID=A0A399T1T4_9BACT|nr:TonB-dependent receptor [Maribellus luteus]RIJ47903.1 TonB-dependent receptor [Maribellus luteus]